MRDKEILQGHMQKKALALIAAVEARGQWSQVINVLRQTYKVSKNFPPMNSQEVLENIRHQKEGGKQEMR